MTINAHWPRHVRDRCPEDCPGCGLCHGNLFSCKVCGGAEASLTTDCAGTNLSGDILDDVQSGTLDYLAKEGWVRK